VPNNTRPAALGALTIAMISWTLTTGQASAASWDPAKAPKPTLEMKVPPTEQARRDAHVENQLRQAGALNDRAKRLERAKPPKFKQPQPVRPPLRKAAPPGHLGIAPASAQPVRPRGP
jgi:hypothetical protein